MKKTGPEDGLFGGDQLQFGWWFGPALTLPGQEGRRQRENRKETRGERDRLAENGGSPHPAKEEPPPFLARRLPFCPGRRLICHTGNPLSSEPIKNTAFSIGDDPFFVRSEIHFAEIQK